MGACRLDSVNKWTPRAVSGHPAPSAVIPCLASWLRQVGSRAKLPELELESWIATWAGYLTSPHLSFLICKMEIIVSTSEGCFEA